MRRLLMTIFVLFTSINLLEAQDQPRDCENPVSLFNDLIKAKITSQVKTAYNYYMNSTDPNVGNTYTLRTANFQTEMIKTFQAFMTARRNEYRNSSCSYYKTTKANPGNRKNNTITVQPGFYLLKSTLTRTTNGDWKGGPSYNSNDDFPTAITWTTGGHQTSNTFVNIKAKYNENFIQAAIINELQIVQKELNDIGIPVELPPFLND